MTDDPLSTMAVSAPSPDDDGATRALPAVDADAPEPAGPDALMRFMHHLGDAQPLITVDPANAGEPPARYVIGRELGAGGIAQVVEAHDEHLGRDVALKVMPATGALSRERLLRFMAEAQVTAQLEHPAIPPVYEIGLMPGGLPYFAMRLVEGHSLDELINRLRVGDAEYTRHYPPPERARLFLRICQGMAYAHAKGVVHRDLKPSNILLGRYGGVQIMDWGLAKLVPPSSASASAPVTTVRADLNDGAPPPDDMECASPVTSVRVGLDDGATHDGDVAGTPAYMSPEQARGRNTRVGPPADVYALGLMLAELMTLVRVMRPASPVPPARRYAAPVDAAALNPRMRPDPELTAIIRRCTEPTPGARFPDAVALEGAMRAYLGRRFRSDADERPVPPKPVAPNAPVPTWRVVAGTAVGALAAFGALTLLQSLYHGVFNGA